jgi:hypothetical protein
MASDEAMAYLNMARQYQKAASRLLDSVEGEKVGGQYPLSSPIYFLYSHTVELALKAFLLFHDEEVPTSGREGHGIVALHSRCAALGLRLSKDDPYGLQNVVSLLASENDHHGFRYFSLKNTGAIPDLQWTHDVVNSLIAVVRERLGDSVPGEAVKIQFILGPVKQRKS